MPMALPSPRAKRPRTLWRLLALRIAATAALICTALIAFFMAKYLLDQPGLRRATLEAKSAQIINALRAGQNPAKDTLFRDYPGSYGFRVVEHRSAPDRRTLSEASANLLPPIPSGADDDLSEGMLDMERPGSDNIGDRWLLTDRVDLNGRPVWIETVMLGDPAGLWRGVMLTELFDHVFVPMATVVPLLTLATLLSVRHALRQLGRLGRQAEALGAAALRGRPLQPLPDAGLPQELHALVGAINVMLQALSRVLAAQREFAADAAHELRTPLAVMALQVSELPQGPATAQLASELADLGRLVGQLLRLAQAENAMLSAQGTVDLCTISRNVCETLASSAILRRQSISFEVPGHAVAVEGNAELIEIALRNLVDNALKVSPPAATVLVRVVDGGKVIVDDEGPGIPDSIKKVVFRRFWRDDRRRGAGAGIGLALVRKIADLHGGEVLVEDRQDGGSRFILAFAS